MSALGRFLITRKETDIAAFKTPNLRNVLVTGPYFHDGSQQTLWDVIDHYNKGDGLSNPYLDEDIEPLALTEQEIDDLVAFLASLTSAQYRESGAKELTRQHELTLTKRPQRDTARPFVRNHLDPSHPALDAICSPSQASPARRNASVLVRSPAAASAGAEAKPQGGRDRDTPLVW
jgi:cytochrome c peroxidase